jgi:hypothetical protein
MSATDKDMARLLIHMREKVLREWGEGFHGLGSRLQRALLAEAVLILAAQQDDDVAAETVRKIIDAGWTFAIDETEGN